eukprot:6199420-Pleurochrysis_carterae.AAC.1
MRVRAAGGRVAGRPGRDAHVRSYLGACECSIDTTVGYLENLRHEFWHASRCLQLGRSSDGVAVVPAEIAGVCLAQACSTEDAAPPLRPKSARKHARTHARTHAHSDTCERADARMHDQLHHEDEEWKPRSILPCVDLLLSCCIC